MRHTTTSSTTGTTWVKRAKFAVAGLVFAGLAVFGAVAMRSSDSNQGDQQAAATWSRVVGPNAATWS